jgi:hypothetical protein
VKEDEIGRTCNTNGDKKPVGRPRRRWVNNIKIDLGEMRWDGMDYIDLAQDRDQWGGLLLTR